MSELSCPHCGAPLPGRARFCRECGSDADMGWRDEDASLEIPDEYGEEEYQEFLRRELPGAAAPPRRKRDRLWRGAAVVLLLALLLWLVLT